MTSRVLGLVRDQVLASLFGASNAMDAYNVAFRVPTLLRDLFAEGAMSAAFVPTFTRHLTSEGRPSAWRLGNSVLNALLVVTSVVVIVGMVFAEPLVTLYAQGFADEPGKLPLTILLARIMMPTLTLIALAAAVMGMLNSLQHFFVPAFSPAAFNVVSIVCALTLTPVMPRFGLEPIVAIAVGTLLGALAQLAVQWPPLRREGFVYAPRLDWSDPGLRRVLVLMGPGTIGLAATQVNLFVNTVLAAGQEPGAVSWLTYAFRLMYLPIGLFGVSVASATLPIVSRQGARDETAAVRETLVGAMTLMMALTVPATVGLIVLAEPIVRVIFERNAFTAADTIATAAALQFFAVGLVGYSIARIASPVFYALGEGVTSVKVSIATVLLNALLSIALVRMLGYRGLALGTSLAALFNAGALLVLLSVRLDGIGAVRLLRALLRIAAAATMMGLAAVICDNRLATWLPGTGTGIQVVRLLGTIGCALVVLAASARLLRIPELTDGLTFVLGRLRRTKG